MDYRNYDQSRSLLPPFIRRHARYLRPLGILFCIIGILIPFFTVIRLVTSTFFLNILAWILLTLGPASFLVGLAFDGYVDRSE